MIVVGILTRELFQLADLIIYVRVSVKAYDVQLGSFELQSIVPNTNYHILLGFPMGRIYTCTFMAVSRWRFLKLELQTDTVPLDAERSTEAA